MRGRHLTAIIAAVSCIALSMPAPAANAISFEGKTVKMIVPSTVGGSTDLAARLFARFLGKYLPGNPAIVASNVPGGQGVKALNFVAQQAKPDGLTIVAPSSNEVDPSTFRTSEAHYDPAKFGIVGGFGFGDTLMIIRADALPRLLDKSKAPVTMGAVAGVPRSGMRMTIWGSRYLGWNTKWVTGYPGLQDLVLALERGEIDMTSFSRFYLVDKLLDTSKYKILYLDGLNRNARPSGRADVDGAPFFTDAMAGKITDPKMRAAFDYWAASTFLFKWLALPPETPKAIVDVYRDAFRKATVDPEFVQQADQTMVGNTIISPEDTVKAIDALAATPDEARATMEELMRNL
jgi:hypothetical protein